MALKKTYSKDKKTCNVTFSVTKEAAHGAEKVALAGEFNGWNCTSTQLKKGKDGNFTVKLPLEAGKEYQFRYVLNGKNWDNDWAADKYVPAPNFQTENSVVMC